MLSLLLVFIVRQLELLPPPLPAPMPTQTRTPVVASALSAAVVHVTVMLRLAVLGPGALLLMLPNGSVGLATAVQTATARAGAAASRPANSSSRAATSSWRHLRNAAAPVSAARRSPPPWAGRDLHPAGARLVVTYTARCRRQRLPGTAGRHSRPWPGGHRALHLAAHPQRLPVHCQQGQAQRRSRAQLEGNPVPARWRGSQFSMRSARMSSGRSRVSIETQLRCQDSNGLTSSRPRSSVTPIRRFPAAPARRRRHWC